MMVCKERTRVDGAGQQPTLSIEVALDAFLLSLRAAGRSGKTISLYRCVLNRLVRRFQGETVQAVAAQIVAYIANLADSGVGPATFKIYVTLHKHFFAWLEEGGYIHENPLALVKTKSAQPPIVKPFTSEEVARLLAAARSPLETACLFLLLDTGMRASELAGLTLASIDLAQDVLTILGKGSKLRQLALNPLPKRALLAYMESRAAEDGLLWPPGWTNHQLAYLLKKLAQRARVGDVHPHRFRHHWAMATLSLGVDPLALKQLGGWTDFSMVERYVAAGEQKRALTLHRQHSVLSKLF